MAVAAPRKLLSYKWHCVGFAIVLVAMVAGIWGLHVYLHPVYLAASGPLIRQAVRNYVIRREDGKTVVFAGSRRLAEGARSDGGPLGLERISSFAGVLQDTESKLRDDDAFVQGLADRERSHWVAVPGRSFRATDIGRFGLANRPGASNRRLHLKTPDVVPLSQQSPREHLSWVFDRLISAEVMSDCPPRCPELPTIVTQISASRPGRARSGSSLFDLLHDWMCPTVAGSDAVVARTLAARAMERARAELPEVFKRMLGSAAHVEQPEDGGAVQAEMRDAILRHFTGPIVARTLAVRREHQLVVAKLRETFNDPVDGTQTPTTQPSRQAPDSPPVSLGEALDGLSREREQSFHDLLLLTALPDLTYFWLFGCWQWWEIAFSTVFGVLVKALFDLGYVILRGGRTDDNKLWSPDGSLHIVARVVYAPFISIAFIWLAVSTHIVDNVDSLGVGTFGALAFAFMVGMVPHHVLALMLNFVRMLLRAKPVEVGGAATEVRARRVAVSGRQLVTGHEPPTIKELKGVARRIVDQAVG